MVLGPTLEGIVEDLAALPVDHPLRNRPLFEIGAERRWRQGTIWNPVTKSYGIAKSTFNDLGPAWTEPNVWRATKTDLP